MTRRPSVVGSIASSYRAVICDLDGVVYRGSRAVPGAIEALGSLLGSGRSITFATNNASREPGVVEGHLKSLGMETGAWSVVTSAQAAAACVVDRIGTSHPVLAVGGPGVGQALHEAGLRPVTAASGPSVGQAAAVVQGAGTNVNWRDLAETAHQVRGGALWVATNPDRSIPTSRGLAPGNGAMVAAVQAAVDVSPVVAGKPEPWLYQLALRRLGVPATDALVIGDRLDTDIAAAHAAGIDSLFVLSGVHGLRDVVFCPRAARPTFVGLDLAALTTAPDTFGAEVARLEKGVVHVDCVGLSVRDAIASVVVTTWHALDSGLEVIRDPGAWRSLEAWVSAGL